MVVLSKIWLLTVQVSGDSERVQNAQLRATLCLARAAGPAAVLSAVRRRLAGTARADTFCSKVSSTADLYCFGLRCGLREWQVLLPCEGGWPPLPGPTPSVVR